LCLKLGTETPEISVPDLPYTFKQAYEQYYGINATLYIMSEYRFSLARMHGSNMLAHTATATFVTTRNKTSLIELQKPLTFT
jgi:hypothetical protein